MIGGGGVKEHPILFSAPMVSAILDGRKTQTRRVVKLPLKDKDFGCELAGNEIGQFEWNRLSPYGGTGDRLWVREAWALDKRWDKLAGGSIEPVGAGNIWHCCDYDDHRPAPFGRYRHARFMPRWASRITLEITGVRVERLQEISADDAIAEGIAKRSRSAAFPWRVYASEDYAKLWDTINAKKAPWASNPWVWCVSFKRI